MVRHPTSRHNSDSLPEVCQSPSLIPCDPPEISGLQTVIENEKEVHAQINEKETFRTYEYDGQLGDSPWLSKESQDTRGVRRYIRKPLAWVVAAVLGVVLLGVALGTGLGIGLDKNKSITKPSNETISASSSKGAYKRSGLAACYLGPILAQTYPAPSQLSSNQTSSLIFFQHHSGDIRWMKYTAGEWMGGTSSESVVTDAKPGTPLSVRCPQADYFGGLQVFYIDSDNLVRERTLDNHTYVWSDGSINSMNIKALDSEEVGLRAGFYYGPIFGIDTEGTDPFTGVRLWIATGETTFNQYSWRPGLPKWHNDYTWQNVNGSASPAGWGWAAGQLSYVMFVNQDSTVNMYWIDTSSNKHSTDTHPINVWTKSSISIPNIDPTAGVNFNAGYLFARVEGSDSVDAWNITFAAENSTLQSTSPSQVAGPVAMADTRVEVAARRTTTSGSFFQDEPNKYWVFYHTEADGITMSVGDVATGTWESVPLPIPQD